jgi:Na+-transporting NADH:ubiquinone oxidoreductase subunit NqrC
MKSEYRIFLLLFCLTYFASIKLQAQVNAYAKVTAISGKTLTLSSVTETYHTFEDGEKIIMHLPLAHLVLLSLLVYTKLLL